MQAYRFCFYQKWGRRLSVEFVCLPLRGCGIKTKPCLPCLYYTILRGIITLEEHKKMTTCKRCNKREIDSSRSKRHCSICADKYLEYSRKQTPEYKREKSRRGKQRAMITRVSVGLCLNCGNNRISEKSKTVCDGCLEVQRIRNNKKYHEDPKKHRGYVYTWMKKNLDKLPLYQKKYADSHKTKIKIKNHHRRERVRNIDGTFTQQEWELLCQKHDDKCLWCGKKKELSVDHVIPIIKGGTGYIDNIQPLCRSCNSKKGKRILDFRPFGSAILEWT